VAARTRRVIWTESARHALDEVIAYISQESPDGAVRVLTRALDAAASLSTFAERGRVVREIGESTLRELLVYDYRMLYRVREDRVVIRAFLHGARDFSKWRREQAPEL
jgi:plasmid stabilization system protein ParE